ncbi:hypothetical protein DFH08DRAFT_820902 [Mycena albidolilacea]|uniref:Uncharacterized protein n=1 Tax=Mycena albidolilacea TaxID=1033008 RepID=A0AAD7EE24_9AGAR|nr:hypothetical protein DFH08DRAFT_820902 [Mycena albidolilacea]
MSEHAKLLLDSSPLKPDSVASSPTAEPGSPVRLDDPTTPSPTCMVSRSTHSTQNKCPAKDMTQFSTEVSCVHKLTKVNHEQLQTFAKYPQAEQLIFLAGSIFSLAHHQPLLVPTDAPIVLPKKLQGKILDYASIVMLDPSVPAYHNEKIGAVKLLMDLIITNGVSWGFTNKMKDDHHQMKAVKDEAGGALTTRRNGIKNTITASLGDASHLGETLCPNTLNIVELMEALISQQKVKTIKIDVALCGCVAVLRQVVTEDPSNKYWTTVDSELENLQVKYPNPVKMSKFIKKHMLDPDFKTYGAANIPKLSRPSASRTCYPQASAPAVASGSGSVAS